MTTASAWSRARAPTLPAGPFGRTRVLLVDDHPLVREGLAVTLGQAPDLEVCGQAASASQALQAAAAQRPNVAVVDLTLEGSHGIDLLKDLRAQHPEIRLLVLSMHDEALYAERAARAGARGYLMKKEPPEKLLEAVRKVARGGMYFSEAMIIRIHRETSGSGRLAGGSPVNRLGDRELEVLEMLGRGLKTRQIAADLHLSMKTVQAHCEHLKEKLELPDFMSLLRFAVHWLDTPPPGEPARPAASAQEGAPGLDGRRGPAGSLPFGRSVRPGSSPVSPP